VKHKQSYFLRDLAAEAIKSCMFGTRSRSKLVAHRLLPRTEVSAPEVRI
jgi:hypothetical protein